MTENEQKIIKKISDLSGDYKCYDNRINHEESLVLDRLLSEIQQYRTIGTVEDIKKGIKQSEEEFDMLMEYRAIGTIKEFKALKEKMEELHKIVMCEQQSTSCEYTKIKSFEMIENILCET